MTGSHQAGGRGSSMTTGIGDNLRGRALVKGRQLRFAGPSTCFAGVGVGVVDKAVVVVVVACPTHGYTGKPTIDCCYVGVDTGPASADWAPQKRSVKGAAEESVVGDREWDGYGRVGWGCAGQL